MDYDKDQICWKTIKKEGGVNYMDIMRLIY